jgi:hypothetical protein
MKTEQRQWRRSAGWQAVGSSSSSASTSPWRPDVAFAFGARAVLEDPACLRALREELPSTTTLIGCSTAGEISGTSIEDDTLSVTTVAFEHTRVRLARRLISDRAQSRAAARAVAAELDDGDLVSVFVLADGLRVQGSELAAGMTETLGPDVVITGGLAADGPDFNSTVVLSANGVERDAIVALGFYGNRLKVGHGSMGGWDPFGPYRRVTRASGHVLYELDGKSALALYKKYLGDHADGLPGTGLYFPLSVSRSRDEPAVVRTVISTDEDAKSMTFAGEIPEGAYAQLMRANVDRLVDGALSAARATHGAGAREPALSLLISCVGRRMVLRQRAEEELEAVREVLGPATTLTGFYSYGELAPSVPGGACELHNQTMTLVTLAET